MTDSLLGQIAAQGLLGVMLVIVLVAYYKKDKLVDEVQEKRHNDLKCFAEKLVTLVGETNKTLQSLTDAIKFHEKR